MNIAFFITPKIDSVYLLFNSTMRQALEKMEYHRYSALPLIDEAGRYICTLTEGDLLWKLKNSPDLTFKDTNKIFLRDIPVHRSNKAVSINSNLRDVLILLAEQNFVPIVDDHDVFVGIVKRSTVLNYYYDNFVEKFNLNNNSE